MSTLTDQIKAKCATTAENQRLIYEKGKSEGGGGEPTTPTDNRTSLSYWYQYLASDWYCNEEGNYNDYVIDELAYPQGVKNITDVSYFAQFNKNDNSGYSYNYGLPVKKFIGTMDLSNVQYADYMFNDCGFLEDFGSLTFSSKLLSTRYMFAYCSKLLSIPPIPTQNCKNFYSMVTYCSNLSTIPELDTRNGTNFGYMFSGCSNLSTIPELDVRNSTNNTYITLSCKNLTSARFKNIKVNTQIGSGTSYGHLINAEDLIFMIYHLRNTGSSKTFTIGSANLAKLANVYVKTIPITDAMRAEDDLIDEKLPFEVCASTDEGAIEITTYVTHKKWTLK